LDEPALEGAALLEAALLEAGLEGAVLLEAPLAGALEGPALAGALEGAVLLEAALEGANLLETEAFLDAVVDLVALDCLTVAAGFAEGVCDAGIVLLEAVLAALPRGPEPAESVVLLTATTSPLCS
jgi:hypothetical protein